MKSWLIRMTWSKRPKNLEKGPQVNNIKKIKYFLRFKIFYPIFQGDGKEVSTKKRRNEVAITQSSTKFADFGGNDTLLCDICKLLAHLKHPEMYR